MTDSKPGAEKTAALDLMDVESLISVCAHSQGTAAPLTFLMKNQK